MTYSHLTGFIVKPLTMRNVKGGWCSQVEKMHLYLDFSCSNIIKDFFHDLLFKFQITSSPVGNNFYLYSTKGMTIMQTFWPFLFSWYIIIIEWISRLVKKCIWKLIWVLITDLSMLTIMLSCSFAAWMNWLIFLVMVAVKMPGSVGLYGQYL